MAQCHSKEGLGPKKELQDVCHHLWHGLSFLGLMDIVKCVREKETGWKPVLRRTGFQPVSLSFETAIYDTHDGLFVPAADAPWGVSDKGH